MHLQYPIVSQKCTEVLQIEVACFYFKRGTKYHSTGNKVPHLPSQFATTWESVRQGNKITSQHYRRDNIYVTNSAGKIYTTPSAHKGFLLVKFWRQKNAWQVQSDNTIQCDWNAKVLVGSVTALSPFTTPPICHRGNILFPIDSRHLKGSPPRIRLNLVEQRHIILCQYKINYHSVKNIETWEHTKKTLHSLNISHNN